MNDMQSSQEKQAAGTECGPHNPAAPESQDNQSPATADTEPDWKAMYEEAKKNEMPHDYGLLKSECHRLEGIEVANAELQQRCEAAEAKSQELKDGNDILAAPKANI